MDRQGSEGITDKVLGLYRKLVGALDVLAAAEDDDTDAGGCAGEATPDLVIRIRELGAELERLLGEDGAPEGGDYGGRAARVRLIEREIASLSPRIRNLGREQPTSKEDGWSY